ncbi:451_t:CDS:2 [Paraglomus occultum]|uniref:Phosphatidylglycerol/phosphatidylinositol transfer protein n=1 Tax=Paraglomus occultum TaxID=144539 RepID=A0A9N8VI33_9GLOM|nr:451_t:CDS:2 [Paraglomus occultum]
MHMRPHLLLAIIALTQCVSATQVSFRSCANQQSSLNVNSVDVLFDEKKNELAFIIEGDSNTTVYGSGQNFLATAFTTVNVVEDKLVDDTENYCQQTACPSYPGPVTIQKIVNLPRSVPLTTLTVTYRASDENATQITCLDFDFTPQYNYYSQVFTWLPASMTLFTWVASSIACVFSPGQFTTDIFQITSNQGQSLKFKTPGFFDIMFYTQFAIATAQLSLDYPGYYQPFMSHFGWGSLIFNHTEIVSVQHEIPAFNNINIIKSRALELTKRVGIFSSNSLTLTLQESLDLLGGLGNYVLFTGLRPVNLFPETLVIFLIIFAIVAVLCGLIWGSWETLKTIFSEKFRGSTAKGFSLLQGSLLRVFFLFYFPLLTAAFYQLTIRKLNPAWVTVLAVIVVLVPCLTLPVVLSIYLLRSEQLSTDSHMLLRYGTLYNTFKKDYTYFLIFVWIYLFLRAMVTGSGQDSGAAQATLLLIIEILYLIAIVVKQPYKRGGLNTMYVVLGLFRTLISGLLLLLIPNINIAKDTKEIVGYAIITFHGLAYCTFTFLALKHLLEILLRWCGLLEKQDAGVVSHKDSTSRYSAPSDKHKSSAGNSDEERRGSNATPIRYGPHHTYEHVHDGSVSGSAFEGDHTVSDENGSTYHGSQRLSSADVTDESYYRPSKLEWIKRQQSQSNGREQPTSGAAPVYFSDAIDERNNSMSSYSFPSNNSDIVASMSLPRRTPLGQMTNIQPWNPNMQTSASGVATNVPPVHGRLGSVDSVIMMHPGPVSSTAEESTTYQPPRQPLAGEYSTFGRQNGVSENIIAPPPGVTQPSQSSSFLSRFAKKIFGFKKKQDEMSSGPYSASRFDNGSLIDSRVAGVDRTLFVVNPDNPHRASIVHVGFPASEDYDTDTRRGEDRNDNRSGNNFASESRDNTNAGLFTNTSTGMLSTGLSGRSLGSPNSFNSSTNTLRDESVGRTSDTLTRRSPYSVSPTFSPNLPPSILPTMSPNLPPTSTHSTPALLPTLSYTAQSPAPRTFTPISQRSLSPLPLSQSANTYNIVPQYDYATGSGSQRFEIDATRSVGSSTSSRYDEDEEEIHPIDSGYQNNFI